MNINGDKILIILKIICINIINIFFHIIFFVLFWGVGYLSILSWILIFIYSLSLFKKSLSKLKYFVWWIIVLQLIIWFTSFPSCEVFMKYPSRDCSCLWVEKLVLWWTQCIGKIKSCYNYENNSWEDWDMYKLDGYNERFQVSCRDS